MRKIRLLIILGTLIFPLTMAAQDRCVSPARLGQIRAGLAGAMKAPVNSALSEELKTAATQLTLALAKDPSKPSDGKEGDKLKALSGSLGRRVCTILGTDGWPTRAMVGEESSAAFMFLISKALTLRNQLEIYPIVLDAFKAGDLVPGEVLAGYIDRLRLALGMKQLFGTQVYVRDGFLVLAPIVDPAAVGRRREQFKMTSLRSYETFLEDRFQLPLYRAVGEPVPPPDSSQPEAIKKPNVSAADSSLLTEAGEPLVNIETAFVRLDIVVPDAVAANADQLEKADFRVLDNGRPVSIETFSKADAPFDIVLLLDLSGSTADKVGMIKKTTRKFVEMKRDVDRIAVVTFNDSQTIVSPLESDKAKLLKSIKKIGGNGSSHIWDAIAFGLDTLDQGVSGERRKAIVVMTDGEDNALTFSGRIGSKIGFADLVEKVRRSTPSIFPIYLGAGTASGSSETLIANARNTLSFIADQSAGNMYFAKKLEDLSDVYGQVLKDVGTVYTVGFTPDIEAGDPRWRELKIDVPTHPRLKIRYRPGYFTD